MAIQIFHSIVQVLADLCSVNMGRNELQIPFKVLNPVNISDLKRSDDESARTSQDGFGVSKPLTFPCPASVGLVPLEAEAVGLAAALFYFLWNDRLLASTKFDLIAESIGPLLQMLPVTRQWRGFHVVQHHHPSADLASELESALRRVNEPSRNALDCCHKLAYNYASAVVTWWAHIIVAVVYAPYCQFSCTAMISQVRYDKSYFSRVTLWKATRFLCRPNRSFPFLGE
jgi:hypothetical protein